MTIRSRLLALGAICVLALAGAVGYVVHSRASIAKANRDAPPVAEMSLATANAGPHIVFRNTALGPDYGRVAVVSLRDPGGPRAIADTNCDRVYAAGQRVVCLSANADLAHTDALRVLNSSMREIRSLPATGTPSRARLSRDASLAATTTFVSGDSYAGTNFSTRTTITDLSDSKSVDLENYTLLHDGRSIHPISRNYWGVTFAADDDTFYATAAWSGHTWLSRGSISKRTITTLHEDAECPSLSPDGKHIVYKQRGNLPPGQWRLVEYDVATGAVTPLAETRSVDDQVAWLNNSSVMYGLPRNGSQAAVYDVWQVPADGKGKPAMLIPQAYSPSLVG